MAKMRLDTKQMRQLITRVDELGGNVKKAVITALTEDFNYIMPNINHAFKPHNMKYTHETMHSLTLTPNVEQSGTVFYLQYGFDIGNGGLPSVFLMYGTSKLVADKKLYNAVRGAATKRKINAINKRILLPMRLPRHCDERKTDHIVGEIWISGVFTG